MAARSPPPPPLAPCGCRLTGSLLPRLVIWEGPVAVAVAAPALGVEAAVPLVLPLTSPAPNAEVAWRKMPLRIFFFQGLYVCVRVLCRTGFVWVVVVVAAKLLTGLGGAGKQRRW